MMELSPLCDVERGELMRREGVHDGDLERWREEAIAGLGGQLHNEADLRRIRELEKGQAKLDKRLREAKALLELSKKVNALWEVEDDDTPQG
jgi:hypothetical protein